MEAPAAAEQNPLNTDQSQGQLRRTRGVSELTSRIIALVRFPLPLAVMAVHVFRTKPFTAHGVDYSFDDMPLTNTLLSFVQQFVADFSVPTFFFISGLLFFAGGFSAEIYRRKLKRRARSLLIPYIVWNLLALGYIAAFELLPFKSDIASICGEGFEFTVGDILRGMWVGLRDTNVPFAGTLWFIRELMTVIVLSPLLAWMVRKLRWWPLVAFWAVWAACFVVGSEGYLRFISSALLFFTAGAYFSLNHLDPAPIFVRRWRWALAMFVGLGVVTVTCSESLPVEALRALKALSIPCALVIVFAVAAIWGGTSLRQRLLGQRALSDAIPGIAFFIFAAHGILFFHWKIAMFTLLRPESDAACALTFIATYATLFLLICAVYLLLGRIFPTIQRLLSGRL